MEKLARALSVIQQGMLRNNPGFVKDSVNEATEATHPQVPPGERGEIPEENGISPRYEEIGDLPETTFI